MSAASQLQLRRGNTAQHAVFTGAPGEVTVDTDKKTVVVHDGSTQGGFPLARADQVVNVIDYGADSTGAINSRPAIEAAIASSPAGGSIYFPSGTYLINTNAGVDPILIPSTKTGLNIYGDGATLLCTAVNNAAFFRIDASEVVVQGLTFDGFARAGNTVVSVFPVSDGDISMAMLRLFGQRTSVHNCRFIDGITTAIVSRDGVGLVKSGGHRITNNLVRNVYRGIQFGSTNPDANTNGLTDFICTDNVVRDNSFVGVRSESARGIQLFEFANCPGLQRVLIANNLVINAGDLNIELYGTHKSVNVSGNYSEGSRMALSVGGADDVVVTGNTLRGAKDFQLEIALSARVEVSGNLISCKTSDGTYPANSNKNCINISNQGIGNCDYLSINGNLVLDCLTALFTNSTQCSQFIFSNNTVTAEATVAGPLNYVFNTSGTRDNWLISNNIFQVIGNQMTRILELGGGNSLKCDVVNNVFVGSVTGTAVGFGNVGWLNISNNNFRELACGLAIVNTAGVTNVSYSNNIASDYTTLTKFLPDTKYPVEQLIQQPWFRSVIRIGDTPVVANSGAWQNWASTPTFSQKMWSCGQPAATAAGWARALSNEFALETGAASATPAGRSWLFRVTANIPADSLNTTLIWGSQGTETGGALIARGLRFSANGISGTSNATCVLGVHNGTSETTSSFVISVGQMRALVFVWEPNGQTPGIGSRFRVFGSGVNEAMTPLGVVTLAEAFNNAFFEGAAFAAIAHSSVATPGYTANWGLGDLTYYFL